MTVTVRTTRDIASCRALRRTVFIDEQGVPEADEIDDLDDTAIHLLALDGDTPVGTARLLIAPPVGKIGRLCVLPPYRGTGLGAALVQASLAELRALPDLTTARLGAQVHAIGFYDRLGFTLAGPVYDDAGIAHRDMTFPL